MINGRVSINVITLIPIVLIRALRDGSVTMERSHVPDGIGVVEGRLVLRTEGHPRTIPPTETAVAIRQGDCYEFWSSGRTHVSRSTDTPTCPTFALVIVTLGIPDLLLSDRAMHPVHPPPIGDPYYLHRYDQRADSYRLIDSSTQPNPAGKNQ